MTRKKRKLVQEDRPTRRNGNKCRTSVITSEIKVVASNIWSYGCQVDRNTRNLWQLRKIKGKSVCIQKQDQGDRIFVEMTGTITESLISDRYWIVVIDYYIRYSWRFFTKTKSQLPKKVEEFKKNDITRYSR